MRQLRDGPRAFTLAELIVSFGVLIPVIVVAVGIFPFSHIINHEASEVSAAYDVARAQMETLRNYSFDTIPASSSGSTVRDGVSFAWQATATTYGNLNPVMRKKLTVAVTWKVKKSQQLQLDSLVTKLASP